MSTADLSFIAQVNRDEFEKMCETALVLLPGYDLSKEGENYQLKEINGIDPLTGAYDVTAQIRFEERGIYTVAHDFTLEPNNYVLITTENPGIGGKQKKRCEAVATMIKGILIGNILSIKEADPNREDLILDQIEVLADLNREKVLTDEEFTIVRKVLLMCF